MEKITPFISFSQDSDIKEIHSLLAPDISLPDLYMQFNDLSNATDTLKDTSLNHIISKLCKTVESRSNYKEIITVFGRIAACTPHSSDMERQISANNRLKTKLRSSISIETENKYMYIHTNKPNLSEWNPTAAAKMFVEEKHRRNRDVTSANETTRRQPVFKAVSSEAQARACKENDEDDEDDNVGYTMFEF